MRAKSFNLGLRLVRSKQMLLLLTSPPLAVDHCLNTTALPTYKISLWGVTLQAICLSIFILTTTLTFVVAKQTVPHALKAQNSSFSIFTHSSLLRFRE